MEHNGSGYFDVSKTVPEGVYERSWHGIPSVDPEHRGHGLKLFVDVLGATQVPNRRQLMEVDGAAGFDDNGNFGIRSNARAHVVLVDLPSGPQHLPPVLFNFIGLVERFDFDGPARLLVRLKVSGKRSRGIIVSLPFHKQIAPLPPLKSLLKVNHAGFAFVDPFEDLHFSSEAVIVTVEAPSTLIINLSPSPRATYERTFPQPVNNARRATIAAPSMPPPGLPPFPPPSWPPTRPSAPAPPSAGPYPHASCSPPINRSQEYSQQPPPGYRLLDDAPFPPRQTAHREVSTQDPGRPEGLAHPSALPSVQNFRPIAPNLPPPVPVAHTRPPSTPRPPSLPNPTLPPPGPRTRAATQALVQSPEDFRLESRSEMNGQGQHGSDHRRNGPR